jgi:hypothetical protein
MKLVKEMSEEVPANQMSLISDTDEIVKFLEFAGNKSILNEHTVQCRLTACNNLFSILNEGEDNVAYMIQNLDLLVNRFRNKNSNVQDSTLKVYKSRVKSSLEDFQAWSKDPVAWEKTVMDKSNNARAREKKPKPAPVHHEPKVKAIPDPEPVTPPPPRAPKREPQAAAAPSGGRRVSFPVRPDFNLEMTIPNDGLSMKELLKLGLFLYPYCKESQDTRAEDTLTWGLVPRVTN